MLCAALAFPTVVAQETAPFEFFENFDGIEADGSSLPEGWLSTGTVPFVAYPASWTGMPAVSGDNIAFSAGGATVRDEVLYTPMLKLAGGKECAVSFSFIAPGGTPSAVKNVGLHVKAGTAQNAESQTIAVGEVERKAYPEWTEFTFKFTPREDGEYCVSFQVHQDGSTLAMMGNVGIEDVEITGEAPVEDEVEPGQLTALDFFENFDEVTADGSSLPEGWLSTGTVPFAVNPALWTGMPAVSGDNIAFSAGGATVRDEVLYTPMLKLAGGKECAVSFSFIAPGGTPSAVKNVGLHVKAGTAQNAESQTIAVGEVEKKAYPEWTEFTFKFTPREDGEYCVSFQVHQDGSTLAMMGNVGIEDVEITGFSPAEVVVPGIELEPDPENEAEAVEIPYIEDFEGENYDGTTYVPIHWLATGTQPFVTASITEMPATSGDWYVVTQNSQELRDERLYTPFFVLEAGKEYVVSYQLYLPGQVWGSDNVTRKTDVTVTVGCQQEADFHMPLDKITNYANTGFEKREVRFTPEKAGAYCFSFSLSSAEPFAGYVAIDDFSITTEGAMPAPKARFAVSHTYDVRTSGVAAFFGQQIQLVNLSEYGESYEWSVDREEALLSSATSKNPTISFTAGGDFKVTLKVTNSRTSRSTSKTINVSYFGQPTTIGLATNGYEDKMITRGEIPTFGDGGEFDNDFVTGPNKYYYVFAERFALPEDEPIVITQVNLGKAYIHYKIINNSLNRQHNVPFTLAFYGETDGALDENKEFGGFTSTMAKTFGTTGIGSGWGEFFDIMLDEPVTVTGNCYLAFIVDDSFDMVVEDTNVGASYMGLVGVKHTSGVSTMYVKPKALPETSHATVGEWVPVEHIDPALKGYGLWATIWGHTASYTGVAFNTLGDIVFDVLVNGDQLIVSGTEEGEAIRVYDLGGALVAAATGTEVSSTVDIASLQPGVYVVKTSCGVKKFVK